MKYILIDQNTAKEEIDKFLEGTEKEILRVICEEVIKPTYLCINYSGKPFVITAEYFADVMQLALAVQIEEGPAKTYPHVKDNYYEGIRGVNYHCRQPRNPHSMECQECQMAVHNLRSKHGNSYTESRPKYIHHVASE